MTPQSFEFQPLVRKPARPTRKPAGRSSSPNGPGGAGDRAEMRVAEMEEKTKKLILDLEPRLRKVEMENVNLKTARGDVGGGG